jgi:hypothetical protein
VAFGGHGSVHGFGESLADHQAETGAAVTACAGLVHLAEGLEKAVNLVRRNAVPGVLDCDFNDGAVAFGFNPVLGEQDMTR